MRERDVVGLAARNNAEWCDVFCRTHGVAGRLDDDAWSSARRTPPFYPDAVTLVPGAEARGILSRVEPGPGCSIKDSFGDLDLSGEGVRSPVSGGMAVSKAHPRRAAATVGDRVGRGARDLGGGVGRVTGGTAVLPPGAGRGGSIAILAHYEGRAIAAGAVANRSAAAIGLSNVFSADGDLESAYVGAARAQARWGSLPVVGYEFGDSLDAARRAGFSTVGGLAVWASR
ncbi:MAG TPA: hypothetical protein VGQ15_12640 [Gaiellaceae bacterium]|nr:hypothetical protein [Gaiellaceae bacterium]